MSAFQHPALAEKVDLPQERKEEILQLEARLGTANPFELLGVAPGAPASQCKTAYYALSMRFHPDRFYGKEIGTYRARIDKIFRKLTEVQLLLTDEAKRDVFTREHPEFFRVAGAAPVAVAHDGIRAADRARRIASHPYLAKAMKVKQQLDRAKAALASGQAAQAALDLEALVKIDPHNEEAKALLEKATEARSRSRDILAVDEAKRLEEAGEDLKAIQRYSHAIARVEDPAICQRALKLARKANDLKSAKAFASRWTEIEPKSALAHLGYAEVLDALGMTLNARREAEEASKLDPTNKVAKTLHNRLRWGLST